MPTVTVVTSGPGAPDLNPKTVAVPNGNQTITWQINGTGNSFPATNYFSWVTSPAPLNGTLPTRNSAGTELTLSYDNQVTSVTNWTYNLNVILNNGNPQSVDPVIQNDPPTGGPGPMPRPKPGPPSPGPDKPKGEQKG